MIKFDKAVNKFYQICDLKLQEVRLKCLFVPFTNPLIVLFRNGNIKLRRNM